MRMLFSIFFRIQARAAAGRIVLISLCVASVLFTVSCEDKIEKTYDILTEYDRNFDYYPSKRWSKLASPELAGWSTIKLEQARQYSESIHSTAVVVIENGVIVAEWGSVTERYKLHSIRKSIMSAMFGIYVDQGILNPANTLKELQISDIGDLNPEEEGATIHDLLTSRSGIFHPAAYETDGMQEKRPPRGSHIPGTYWYYNNWDFNALLTVFNQETKQDFFEQFQERIAKPLQMEHFHLKDTSYHYEAEYSSHPAYLFRMSALDLARFGLLYLREGRWQGKQIISADWIHRSTKNYSILNPKHPERGYGYLWWLDEGVFYASGTGGQRLFIIPKYNLLIVHRVNTDNKIRVKSKPIWNLYDKIIEARKK